MTNEELAVQAQTGNRDALARLWEQNRGLLTTMFRELAGKAGARMAAMGVTWEDVEQSFFLAISLAVQLYRPERDILFASFLSYPVKQVFYNLIGWRTERQKRDPLGQCLSLDEPISEADGTGLRGDFIPDTNDAYEDAEDQLYTEQLHDALDECLATLEPEQAEAVRCRYYCGLNLKDTGARMGITPEQARNLESKGLRKLRNPQNVRRLEPYRQQIISEGAYHGTGWAAWNSGGSVEERTIAYLEDKGLL